MTAPRQRSEKIEVEVNPGKAVVINQKTHYEGQRASLNEADALYLKEANLVHYVQTSGDSPTLRQRKK